MQYAFGVKVKGFGRSCTKAGRLTGKKGEVQGRHYYLPKSGNGHAYLPVAALAQLLGRGSTGILHKLKGKI
jgi:hypothetical protein